MEELFERERRGERVDFDEYLKVTLGNKVSTS